MTGRTASKVLRVTKPSLVIFALGNNDAARDVSFDPKAWRTDYRTLIAQARGSRVAIMGVQPTEAGKLKSDTKDMARVALINQQNRDLATELDIQFVEPLQSTTGKTNDGVHLNKVGRREWSQRLATAC